MTQHQAHDYVTARHRKDDFDPEIWGWSAVIFYIILIGIIAGIFVYKESHACYEEPEPVIIDVTEAI